MRFGVDDTKYIVMIIDAMLEKEKFGQLSPETKKTLESTCLALQDIIIKHPE